MADGRRRRWVAHDVYFLDDPLGAELFDRFGAPGVALWHGFIAACKKNHVEGQTSYSSDQEALVIFGLPGMPLVDPTGQPFGLDDFFDVLGRHKVTRRTKRARRIQVACTRWDQWQNARNTRPPQGSDSLGTPVAEPSDTSRTPVADLSDRDRTRPARSRNRRSEAQNTTKVSAKSERDTPADTDTDTDSKKTPGAASQRKRDLLFEAIAKTCRIDWQHLTSSARGELNKATKDLRQVGATPDEVEVRARVYRRKYEGAALTPSALAKHWPALGGEVSGRAELCPDCQQPVGKSHTPERCAQGAELLGKVG